MAVLISIACDGRNPEDSAVFSEARAHAEHRAEVTGEAIVSIDYAGTEESASGTRSTWRVTLGVKAD